MFFDLNNETREGPPRVGKLNPLSSIPYEISIYWLVNKGNIYLKPLPKILSIVDLFY